MARTSNSDRTNHPEFAVSRETISAYFNPPLAKSTFFDLVGRGKIIPLEAIKGVYKLNESLKRLGLREVAALPEEASKRSMEDIARLAFSLLEPILFPTPPWAIFAEEIDFRDMQQAKDFADLYRGDLEKLNSSAERIGFAAGILDGVYELERGHFTI